MLTINSLLTIVVVFVVVVFFFFFVRCDQRVSAHEGPTGGHRALLLLTFGAPHPNRYVVATVSFFSSGSRSCPTRVARIFLHSSGCVTIMSSDTTPSQYLLRASMVDGHSHSMCSTSSVTAHPSSHQLLSSMPTKLRYRTISSLL